MVVPMKRISLILIAQEKRDFLKRIQQLGVMEIIRRTEKINKALETKFELLAKVRRTIQELQREKQKSKKPLSEAEEIHPEKILTNLDTLREQMIAISREIDRLELDKKKLTPWGNFNMGEVNKLEEYGISTRFYIIPANKFANFDPGHLLFEVIHRDKALVYLIIVTSDRLTPEQKNHAKLLAAEIHPEASKEELLRSIPLSKSVLPIEIKKKQESVLRSIQAYQTHLPQESLESVVRAIEEKKTLRDDMEKQISGFTRYLDALTKFCADLNNSLEYDLADMYCEEDDTGRLTLVEAWFPASEEIRVIELMNSFTLRYTIHEPETSDNPPVMLKNKPWMKPFEVITRVFSLPSYFEMDPTPLFAPFFMLFFGLCIADIGYGVILLAVAIIGFFRADASLKPAFKLAVFLGGFCLIAGYWLNTFFGFYIYENPGVEHSLIAKNIEGDFLAPYRDEQGKQVFPAMSFSLFIGFMQVSFAMLMRALNKARHAGVKYAFKPVSYLLLMYGSIVMAAHNNVLGFADMKIGAFHVGGFVLQAPMDVAYALLGCGFFLSLFLNNPDKKIWMRPPLALWELYEFVSSIVGDILSYLRLFALGLASGLLGEAYNTIAFLVLNGMGGSHSIPGVFFFLVIIIAGHLLNMILAFIGAFVHSLRLTFVEFYKNLHFQGGGKPFTPFSLEK